MHEYPRRVPFEQYRHAVRKCLADPAFPEVFRTAIGYETLLDQQAAPFEGVPPDALGPLVSRDERQGPPYRLLCNPVLAHQT